MTAFVSEINNDFHSVETSFSLKDFLYSETDKTKIKEYMLKRKFVSAASTKKVYDAIAKANDENYCCVYYSDGKYEWNSAEIMYFEKYNLKLNDDFIQHVLSNS